jgi:LysM repeat protein
MYANPLTPQSRSTRLPRLRSVAGAGAAAVLAVGLAAPGVAHAQEVDIVDRHEVEPGDTLAEIAADYGLDETDGWRDIFSVNTDLDDPDLIVPGQVLEIPDPDADVEPRDLPAAPVAPAAPEPAESAPAPAATTGQSATPAPAPQEASTTGAGVWDRLARCESGGNWSINTGNGYYGGLQFSLSSWNWVGGSGYPHEASKGEQIRRAEILKSRQGWSAWPACSSKLGLR